MAISAKTIQHVHLTFWKAIDYAQKIDREFLHVECIQQTESINPSAGNDPMKQQRCVNITCYKCGQKVITGKTAPNQLVLVQGQIKKCQHSHISHQQQ